MSSPIISIDDNDFNITNDDTIDVTIDATSPLLPSTFNSNTKLSSTYRWVILLGFSLLTFASACLWITFAPCLYIFMSYFSQTPSGINSLSSIYMITYPILLIPSIKLFNKYGIKFGVIFGQTIAAIAQLFMLGIPPKLANIWFSEFGEQNFATSVGITANSAGAAAGFLLSPWMIKEKTANRDIPNYLLQQFVFCVAIYLFLIFTFKSSPYTHSNKRAESLSITKLSNSNISYYLSDKLFMLLTTSYGVVTGGLYALSTLLSQMILPVFKQFDEQLEYILIARWLLNHRVGGCMSGSLFL
ncbi:5953_t:CDS:2 [Cetraspora pellucida]|uniref:5953_t:CDS:1 n=1 Tax=Cetraspora pellucida TaxID=1433469 RepID=A0A9N9CIP3_9GLOM|nr:5953_t:CDS:2 [Cetraspora pellucida]